jgi:hypothetical protein
MLAQHMPRRAMLAAVASARRDFVRVHQVLAAAVVLEAAGTVLVALLRARHLRPQSRPQFRPRRAGAHVLRQWVPSAVAMCCFPVLLVPSPHQLALRHARNALAATFVQLAHRHGLILIAAGATTAPMALVPRHPAPFKCLQLADGAIYKSKALHSLWKQPTASTTASGTLHQATACSANARPIPEHFTFFFHLTREPPK